MEFIDNSSEIEIEVDNNIKETEELKRGKKTKAIVAILISLALIFGSISGYFFMYVRPLPHAIFV